MRHTSLSISVLLSAVLISTPVYADWGAMLDDLKSAGQSLLATGSEESTGGNTLDNATLISGLKEALSVGSERAIDTISQTNGFLDNPTIRIPMPAQVQQAGDLMRQFGMTQLADSFETSLNRAAEKAAPAATSIVLDAIKNMTIEDAMGILNGPDDAATQYFQTNTTSALTDLFRPSIETSLNEVGSTRYYNQLSDQIAAVPLVGQSLNVNLPDYVTEQALSGLFTMLAEEEKKIRENPAARTTELLKQVFTK